MKQLWVDDLRDPTEFVKGEWDWAKNYSDAKRYFLMNFYHVISLDNDLGENLEGRHFLNYLEQQLYEESISTKNLKTIYVHTSNPSARREMLSAKDNFKDRFNVDLIMIPSTVKKKAF